MTVGAVVGFVVNPTRPAAAAAAHGAVSWLTERGHTARLVGDGESEGSGETLEGVDLAVSLGGDGTMLRTVDLASRADVPVLGVNLGRLGYLTEVEPAGLEQALERFLAGDYVVEERMTLEVSLETGGNQAESVAFGNRLALNECVIEKTVPGHTIRISASIAGRPFVTYAADGVLVATPTGSTAYNLSVRGPILSPRLRAIVLTPISPHMLFDRALVLEPDEWLRLEVAGPRPGVLVIDGQSAGVLEPGDAVVCRAGATRARLVSFGGRDFHSVLKARFHLTDR